MQKKNKENPKYHVYLKTGKDRINKISIWGSFFIFTFDEQKTQLL